MKIYYINLERSVERNENLIKQLSKFDINYQRVDAIDGTHMTEEQISSLCYKPSGLLCSKSIIGCYASHLTAWKMFLDDNEEQQYGIIMEDDCILHDDFKSKVTSLLQEINRKNPEWDFIYLGQYSLQLFDMFSTKYKNKLHKNVKHYTIPSKIPLGFHCYMINKKSVIKLLNKMNKMYYHVDLQFYFLSKYFSVYSSKDKIAKQMITSEHSTQNTNFPKYLNKFLDKIFYNGVDCISPSYVLSSPLIKLPYIECPITIYVLIFILVSRMFKRYRNLIYIYILSEAFSSTSQDERYNILCWNTLIHLIT